MASRANASCWRSEIMQGSLPCIEHTVKHRVRYAQNPSTATMHNGSRRAYNGCSNNEGGLMSGLFDWSGGSPPIPQWWLALVLPRLERERRDGRTNGQIAHEANIIAGRRNQLWDHTSISRFRMHERARPVALAHALSELLGVPSPFYVAQSETAARAMAAIASALPPDLTEFDRSAPAPESPARRRGRLATIDGVVEQLMPPPKSRDVGARPALPSRDYGEDQGTQTKPRADRTRSRRA